MNILFPPSNNYTVNGIVNAARLKEKVVEYSDDLPIFSLHAKEPFTHILTDSKSLDRRMVRLCMENADLRLVVLLTERGKTEKEDYLVSAVAQQVKNHIFLTYDGSHLEGFKPLLAGGAWQEIRPMADIIAYTPPIQARDRNLLSIWGGPVTKLRKNEVSSLLSLLTTYKVKLYGEGYWGLDCHVGTLNKEAIEQTPGASEAVIYFPWDNWSALIEHLNGVPAVMVPNKQAVMEQFWNPEESTEPVKTFSENYACLLKN